MNHYLKLMSVLLAGAVFSGVHGFAQDKATLDLLVKKGVISQDEAAAVAKQSTLIVSPKEKTTKKLTISGRVQVQFDYINDDNKKAGSTNPAATQQFMIRRANLAIGADLGSGVSGLVDMDFAEGAGSTKQISSGSLQNFDKVYIAKKFDSVGSAKAGMDKVNFVLEENTSASKIKPIERSIATRYFSEAWSTTNSSRLGFGSRHTGLFWDGEVEQIKGLSYAAAVTNGVQSVTSYNTGISGQGMGYWLSTAYENKINEVGYKVGINTGYSQNANSTATSSPTLDMWGFNPYVSLKWQKFEMPAEFILGAVQNANSTQAQSNPWGFNITPSYKFTEQWEGVLRFSYLDTDGRGVAISDVERNAPTTGLNYEKSYAFYVGVNWYIIGNALKVSAGYEFARFDDSLTAGSLGADANCSALRAQIQLLF